MFNIDWSCERYSVILHLQMSSWNWANDANYEGAKILRCLISNTERYLAQRDICLAQRVSSCGLVVTDGVRYRLIPLCPVSIHSSGGYSPPPHGVRYGLVPLHIFWLRKWKNVGAINLFIPGRKQQNHITKDLRLRFLEGPWEMNMSPVGIMQKHVKKMPFFLTL